MAALDPVLAQRRKLGAVESRTLTAPSLIEAHRALGSWLAKPARAAVDGMIADAKPPALVAQIKGARACRAHVVRCADRPATPLEVRRALGEYLACLDAWADAVGLAPAATRCPPVDGEPVSARDLALLAQDDNAGCQTGMLRQRDGSVLLWHTEEDLIGYLDRPRVVTFAAGAERLTAFLYPYLLPGPAFGFRSGQLHAVDSLSVRRERTPEGTFTSIASWLVWRLGPAVPAREVLRALRPFVDGCAINVVEVGAAGISAWTHEIGAHAVQSRRLGATRGALGLQMNAVSSLDCPLGRDESLRPRDRALYEHRRARAEQAVARLLGRGDPSPQQIARMLCSRRGGSYANANADVKAHCVARVSAAGVEAYVQAGSAHPEDVYHPQWRLA